MALRIRQASTTLARQARREPTPMEHRLWQALRGSRLGGFKFRRQAVIEPFRVDFLCPEIGLVIEVDGHTHDPDQDRDRDIALGRLDYTVLRLTNAEVMGNLEGCLETILMKAEALPVRSWNQGKTNPPAPSLGREGEQ